MNNIRINGCEFDFESSMIKSDYVIKSCELHLKWLDNGNNTETINKLNELYNNTMERLKEAYEEALYEEIYEEEIIDSLYEERKEKIDFEHARNISYIVC